MSVPAAAEPRPDRWQELTKAECFELLMIARDTARLVAARPAVPAWR